MKTFRNAFPYITDTPIPTNIAELLEKYRFDGLSDSDRRGQGWGWVGDERMIHVDGKFLFRYYSCQRKANPLAVRHLASERQQKAIDEGRELTGDLIDEINFQAENEVIKYAPVTSVSVFILFWPAKRLLIASGSTAAKCEDALSMLRRTLDGLSAVSWGLSHTMSHAVTEYMTAKSKVYKLPDNLVISPFGKVIFSGVLDSSLKIVLDGVQNDTEDAKNMLEGMSARSVEMSLIDCPDNGQIKNLANFVLHMPLSGNVHLKNFDYDDDVEREDGAIAYIAEMHLVSSYMPDILSALEEFSGINALGAETLQDN